MCIYDVLEKELPGLKIRKDVALSTLTSFKTGGEAACVASPGNAQELSNLIRILKDRAIPYYILGNGTNVLADDAGYSGCIILTHSLDGLIIDEDEGTVSSGAGILLSTLSARCAQAGLTGLEFARGIPGSVGGAVVMNAGAYDGEIAGVIVSAEVLEEKSGRIFTLSAEELQLGYRKSCIGQRGLVVLGASFKLEKGDKDAIKAKMDDFSARRKAKQPLEYPSAGSTFKRPVGDFAGRLIEAAGMKGKSVGGAMVSEKHAGFVINTGNATSADIKELIKKVKDEVAATSGITLECEVRFIPSGEKDVIFK